MIGKGRVLGDVVCTLVMGLDSCRFFFHLCVVVLLRFLNSTVCESALGTIQATTTTQDPTISEYSETRYDDR